VTLWFYAFSAFEGSGDGTIAIEDILEFTEHWGIYDPKARRYMPIALLPEFCRALPPPLGFKNVAASDKIMQSIFGTYDARFARCSKCLACSTDERSFAVCVDKQS
jgi:hypothetical protein